MRLSVSVGVCTRVCVHARFFISASARLCIFVRGGGRGGGGVGLRDCVRASLFVVVVEEGVGEAPRLRSCEN